MASWDGNRSIQLTHSPDNEHHARWSPDGQYLAFLSGRGGDEDGEQVWLLNRAGGEATKLTEIKGGVSDYVWSPDGKRLAVVVQDPDPDGAEREKKEWRKKPPGQSSSIAFTSRRTNPATWMASGSTCSCSTLRRAKRSA